MAAHMPVRASRVETLAVLCPVRELVNRDTTTEVARAGHPGPIWNRLAEPCPAVVSHFRLESAAATMVGHANPARTTRKSDSAERCLLEEC